MACGAEHWLVLDFAMHNASWKPHRFGYGGCEEKGNDAFNRLAIYPDIIADWLWQKAPWVRSSIDFAMACARESKKGADDVGAVAKLALASHYVSDALAVSHTWLDFIADEYLFESGEIVHEYFHDPIEYPAAEYIHNASPSPAPAGASFRAVYDEAQTRAYEIGKQIFRRFFRKEPVEDLVIAGVENSARAVHALFESLEREPEWLSSPEEAVRAKDKWVMRHVLRLSGDEILSRPFDDVFKARLIEELGYTGGAIFGDLKKCPPRAQAQGRQWRKERRRWREVTMAGILPPTRKKKIGASWRPPKEELAD